MGLKTLILCLVIGSVLLSTCGAPTESDQSHSNESKSHQGESSVSHEESESTESASNEGEDKSFSRSHLTTKAPTKTKRDLGVMTPPVSEPTKVPPPANKNPHTDHPTQTEGTTTTANHNHNAPPVQHYYPLQTLFP